jgi:hypothetical protein
VKSTTLRVRPPWGWWTGVTAAIAAGAVVLAGCTGQRAAETPPTTPPVTSPTPAEPDTPEPSGSSPDPVQIEFEFQRPDPICPPVSALQALPMASQRSYLLVDPYLNETAIERFGRFAVICSYERAEVGGDGEDRILEDHARIGAQVRLYPQWEDSPFADLYRPLPVQSAALDDWRTAVGISEEDVRWEGCGEGMPCAEGEEPTVRTLVLHVDFTGHVGNLEFDVTVSYIAQRLPADVELRAVEIFRDFVLAAMEGYELRD